MLVPLGQQIIKGYDHALKVFAVSHSEIPAESFDSEVRSVELQPNLVGADL